MRTWPVFAFITVCLSLEHAESAILFPEEVPTLSAVIYSLLPPMKLGQDSRFGFGFRLGRNADAQFLIELGPQQATEPLGNDSKKREVIHPRRVLTQAEREEVFRKLMDKIISGESLQSSSLASTSINNTSDNNKKT